jgi:surfactin synthase thioesterase subunit
MTKPQLFLFHFAGGNCYSFDFLRSRLADFDVCATELPGRGRRVAENLLTDFDSAAIDLVNQVTKRIRTSEIVLYGHSMGAYLGLRVCGLLEQAGYAPGYLIVSGNAGPGIKDHRTRYLLEREEFIEELRKLGGMPPEFFENEELYSYFEPVLRADFKIAETNGMADHLAVMAPIYAMMGDTEENAGRIGNWANFTHGDFHQELMAGDHFFIQRHPVRLEQVIRQCYRATAKINQP